MRILVNGLSIGAPSGRHVLYGHVRQLARWSESEHEWLVLHRSGEELPADLRLPNVQTEAAPEKCRNWLRRSMWESTELPRLMRREGIGLYFTPNGMILPRSPVPQASLAQNPWCLTPSIHRTAVERGKARLQRAAYRRAYTGADLMVFNSEHMQDLYRRNADDRSPKRVCIAYQGIDDATHEAAARCSIDRDEYTIVSVSVMAHWKGAETLVAAVKLLLDRDVPARLRLVGPWPDAGYEGMVRGRIRELGLDGVVEITGMVPVEDLRAAYAGAKVFCLMSRCESFGIPAVEAQAFGTPVVGSNVCAMPEVGGSGGVYGPPDDVETTANHLQRLLTDADHWSRLSEAARDNAAKYRWSECSRPLLSLFEIGGAEPLQPLGADQLTGAAS